VAEDGLPLSVDHRTQEIARIKSIATLLIDSHSRRLHQLSGRLVDDVTFGYGVLGTIHRGSAFTTTRDIVASNIWKTTYVDAHIEGRIVFFKTISRHQHSIHQDFHPLPADISLSLAAELLTR
jgi:hypothetical protein